MACHLEYVPTTVILGFNWVCFADYEIAPAVYKAILTGTLLTSQIHRNNGVHAKKLVINYFGCHESLRFFLSCHWAAKILIFIIVGTYLNNNKSNNNNSNKSNNK